MARTRCLARVEEPTRDQCAGDILGVCFQSKAKESGVDLVLVKTCGRYNICIEGPSCMHVWSGCWAFEGVLLWQPLGLPFIHPTIS